CLGGLYLHAWRVRTQLGLDARERRHTCGELALYAWFIVVGLLSVATAWAMFGRPVSLVTGLPGMLYALLGLSGIAEWAGRRLAPTGTVAREPAGSGP